MHACLLALLFYAARRHPPPSDRKLGEFKAAAEMLGVKVDSSSAGALQASLNAIRAACQDDAAQEVRPGWRMSAALQN
jgi:exoribonuclease R